MELHLNLASREYLDRRTVRRWLLFIGAAALLLLAVNLIYGSVNLQRLSQIDQRLAELDAALASQQSERTTAYTPEALAQLMAKIEAANQIVTDDQFRWTALLSRLEELLPDDVAIRSLRPNYREHSLQVVAVARDTAAMTELLDALLASEDLHNVYLSNQSVNAQPNGEELVQFSLLVEEAF
jgi:Tfp pilus assembly protein PilN